MYLFSIREFSEKEVICQFVVVFVVPDEKLTVTIRQIGNDRLQVGSSLMFECISTGSNDPRNTPVWRNPAGTRVFPLEQGLYNN